MLDYRHRDQIANVLGTESGRAPSTARFIGRFFFGVFGEVAFLVSVLGGKRGEIPLWFRFVLGGADFEELFFSCVFGGGRFHLVVVKHHPLLCKLSLFATILRPPTAG